MIYDTTDVDVDDDIYDDRHMLYVSQSPDVCHPRTCRMQ